MRELPIQERLIAHAERCEDALRDTHPLGGRSLLAEDLRAAVAALQPESAALLNLMEQTDPKDWPATRGYGYRDDRLKRWHIYVVSEFLKRLETPQ